MSLLREIQNAAVDKDADIPTILRKCKVLAARLGNDQFKQWVEYELNGYPSKDVLPKYRILRVHSCGHFAGPFGSGLKNAPIPLMNIPESFRDYVEHSYLLAPISAYVALIQKKDECKENWAPDLVAHLGSQIYEDMN